MAAPLNLRLSDANGSSLSTLHVPNSSMTLNDVLKLNGLVPRDGSFRFLVDEQGKMINHCEVSRAPPTVRCGVPNNVEQLWIDEQGPSRFASAHRSTGDAVFVLDGTEFAFETVFLTKKKRGKEKRRVGYGFSPNPPFYHEHDLVFLQVPITGDSGRIYNPQSGRVDWKVRLHVSSKELERMRGFWSVWQLQLNLKEATFRGDLTPLPPSFKPHTSRALPATNRTKKAASPPKNKRAMSLKSMTPDAWGEGLHRSSVWLHGRKWNALVCGAPASQRELRGTLVANGSSTRPPMINLDGFQYGMTQCIKIPDRGVRYKLYAPAQNEHLLCVIESNGSLSVEELRGRWVVARLQRSKQHKRKLVLEAIPAQVVPK